MKLNILLYLLFTLSAFAYAEEPIEPIDTMEWRSLSPQDNALNIASLRDPFSDPQVSYGQNQNGQTFTQSSGFGGGFGYGFQRNRGDFRVPELVFKGFIDGNGKEGPMALIQIGGKRIHMVREGDEINIDPTQPRNAIRITKISRLSLTVETGILGTVRVLR